MSQGHEYRAPYSNQIDHTSNDLRNQLANCCSMARFHYTVVVIVLEFLRFPICLSSSPKKFQFFEAEKNVSF